MTEIVPKEPVNEDNLPLPTVVPPAKVKLRFRAEFGLVDHLWHSKLGSAALSEMFFEFDVPWRTLLDGKPLTLKLPYDAADAYEKGGSWVEFILPKK
jgi:hypothetical protein